MEDAHAKVRSKIHALPFPQRSRRGRSPVPERSRSPRHSLSDQWRPSRLHHSERQPRRLRSSSSYDEDRIMYGLFTRMIRESWIATRLKKPPHMYTYNWTTDPNENIENI